MGEANKLDGIRLILEEVPAANSDDLLLLLLYWKLVDGVDISDALITEIRNKGTLPETITRSRRKIQMRLRQVEELLEGDGM